MDTDYKQILKAAWNRKEPVPEYVLRRFESQIAPQLVHGKLTDPYIQEQIQTIITAYDMSHSASIMAANAIASENIIAIFEKVQKARLYFQHGAWLFVGFVAGIISLSGAFYCGTRYATNLNASRIEQAMAERAKAEAAKAKTDAAVIAAAQQKQRLEYLEKLYKNIKNCVGGEIETSKNKVRMCYFRNSGWQIDKL